MRIKLSRLKKIIQEEMMPSPSGTPDEALSLANDDQDGSGFTKTQKAAMGFMNNMMGQNPSSDQLAGMNSQINAYAQQNNVSPEALKNQLHKTLPSNSQHPQYQYDSASGAVSSKDGRKVYGETKVSKAQLRIIIRETLEALI